MSITLSTLRTNVRQIISDTATSPDYSDTLVNRLINSRFQSLAGKINRVAPNLYVTFSAAYTAITDAIALSNNENYACPSNWYASCKLERRFGAVDSNPRYQELPFIPANEQEQYRMNGSGYLFSSTSPVISSYQSVSFMSTASDGPIFKIIPAPPSTSYIYRLTYIRKPAAVSGDSDVLDLPVGWEHCLELDVAKALYATVGDPTTQFIDTLLQEEMAARIADYRDRMCSNNPIVPMGCIFPAW